MRALLTGICLALAATVAQAQQFDVSIIPMSSRAVIDFKDQFTNTVSKGCVGVAVTCDVPFHQRWCSEPRATPMQSGGTENLLQSRLRYSYTPPTGGDTILTSPPRLIVSGVDFSSSSTQPSAVKTGAGNTKEEPVYIEWKLSPSHLIELEVGQLGIIRPLVCIDSAKGAVTATGKIEGKLVTATEEFSRSFVGFGCSARAHASRDLWTDARLALGSGYEHVEVSFNTKLARDISISGGYRHRVMRFDQGTTVRRGDVFGEVGVRF